MRYPLLIGRDSFAEEPDRKCREFGTKSSEYVHFFDLPADGEKTVQADVKGKGKGESMSGNRLVLAVLWRGVRLSARTGSAC
ncbi:hypothetical protein GTY54_00725 [Streptomyces sp. SID625]|nr:hypothetical protein [Streptomyces sp. SID625]